MPSEYEQMITAQAMAAGMGGDNRNYTNRTADAEFLARDSSRTANYAPASGSDYVRNLFDRMPIDNGIADVVRRTEPQDLYKSPDDMTRNPEKSIYASLLHYKFMN